MRKLRSGAATARDHHKTHARSCKLQSVGRMHQDGACMLTAVFRRTAGQSLPEGHVASTRSSETDAAASSSTASRCAAPGALHTINAAGQHGDGAVGARGGELRWNADAWDRSIVSEPALVPSNSCRARATGARRLCSECHQNESCAQSRPLEAQSNAWRAPFARDQQPDCSA